MSAKRYSTSNPDATLTYLIGMTGFAGRLKITDVLCWGGRSLSTRSAWHTSAATLISSIANECETRYGGVLPAEEEDSYATEGEEWINNTYRKLTGIPPVASDATRFARATRFLRERIDAEREKYNVPSALKTVGVEIVDSEAARTGREEQLRSEAQCSS